MSRFIESGAVENGIDLSNHPQTPHSPYKWFTLHPTNILQDFTVIFPLTLKRTACEIIFPLQDIIGYIESATFT